MCGLAPSRALSKNDSVMQSSSNVVLSTIRPPNSDSPSPGRRTTPLAAPTAIASEYDDRAAARVSPPDAEEGAARPRSAEAADHAVRRAPCPLVLLVPRRRVA